MLSKIEKLVACVCVSIMAVLVFVNVIARYVFGNSLAVSDEMSTYLFVLMSFMGTAIAARRKAHLGLSIVTDHVSPRARLIISMVMYAISALFCLLIVIFGIQMVISQYQMGQETACFCIAAGARRTYRGLPRYVQRERDPCAGRRQAARGHHERSAPSVLFGEQ